MINHKTPDSFINTMIENIENDITISNDFKVFFVDILKNIIEFYSNCKAEGKICDAAAKYFYNDWSSPRIMALMLDMLLDINGLKNAVAKIVIQSKLQSLFSDDENDQSDESFKH